MNLARVVAALAGLPESVAGVTVNRFCASSLQAINMAAQAIMLDQGDAFIAGGVESMSRVPMGGFNPSFNPRLTPSVNHRLPGCVHSHGHDGGKCRGAL